MVLVTVAALLALDIGRSIYARRAYATPTYLWQPDPSLYADLSWPPGADLPADAPAGRRIFIRYCAVCHGPDGRGNGPAAPSMIPRPRDFARGLFKYKSTGPGAPPTDDDLIRVVRDGLQASAMPYFRDLLSAEQIRAVVAYTKTLSPVLANAGPSSSITVPPRVSADRASVDRGQALFAAQGCAGCHGADGRQSGTLADAKGYPTTIRDLTGPWTFRGGSDPGQIWMRVTTGLAGSSMPAYANAMTPAQRWCVVNYLLSRARTHVLLRWATSLLEVDAELAAMLTPEAITRVIGMIPDSWLDEQFRRAGYIDYLLRRLEAPREWVEDAVRERALLV